MATASEGGAVNRHHAVNLRWWEEVTPVHAASDFYDVAGFLAGRNALGSVERGAVGDVEGRSLLHLQCHFGLDTLSWARLGATAVGLDFSPAALETARRLARDCGLEESVTFIEGDVTAAGRLADAPFDIVFTSLGVIVWIADIEGWAATVAANLADDGFFYFLDVHPAAMVFDEESAAPAVAYDYFHDPVPLFETGPRPDYADTSYTISSEARSFTWSLADIFSALEDKDLAIHEVREYPFLAWPHFPGMEKGPDGYWHPSGDYGRIPMMLGFKARRNPPRDRSAGPARR